MKKRFKPKIIIPIIIFLILASVVASNMRHKSHMGSDSHGHVH